MSSAEKNKAEEEGPPRWRPSERYPDPAVEVLDPSFAKYRIFNAAVERLASGMR
jgi:gluconolactonase